MDERTSGIILRIRPLTETSLIVHWLTPDAGRIATVAKGARRAKSPFAGKLDLFFDADFSFQRSRRGELHTLREAGVLRFRDSLRRNLAALEQAAWFTRLIELGTETETPLPGVHQLTARALDALAEHGPGAASLFAFEGKLLAELGFPPTAVPAVLSAGTREILSKLTAADWPLLSRLQLSAVQTRELQRFLHAFLVEHLGPVPPLRASILDALVAE